MRSLRGTSQVHVESGSNASTLAGHIDAPADCLARIPCSRVPRGISNGMNGDHQTMATRLSPPDMLLNRRPEAEPNPSLTSIPLP
jgi:hypothetical protein